MKKRHKLLARQIRRKYGQEELIPENMRELFEVISQSYDHFENDRKLIERAMGLSSDELRISYEKLAIQAQLEQTNKELEQFVSIASHDLKAPLRTINSFSQLLKRELEKQQLSHNAEEYLNYILEGTQGMAILIDDLLKYARIGIIKENKEKINLNEILKIVIKNLTCAIEESDAQITFSNKLPTILAHPSQMLQLLQNLMGNAIKFRRRDIKPEIIVDVQTQGKFFLFSIKDNGIGIKDDLKKNAFEVFRQLNNNKDFEGTGLGLSICKKIIESMHGKIWLESSLGLGTTFFFTIPQAKGVAHSSEKDNLSSLIVPKRLS